MITVKLNNKIENGSVVFSVSKIDTDFKSYQTLVEKKMKKLYKERYQLNRLRTFDDSVMEKKFER
jgi:hypothetical protein